MSRAADILVTNRPLVEADLTLLESILLKDGYHPGAGREFFMEPGTVARVYEDAQGPIVFTRCAPVLRLDAKFVSNADVKRNLKALMGGLPALAQQAKEDRFKEVLFSTPYPSLKAFVTRRFGFVESHGELRKDL